jgi:hypothetical protein
MIRSATVLLALLGLAPAVAAFDSVVEIELAGDLFAGGEPSAQGWLQLTPRMTHHLSPRIVLSVVPVLELDTHGDIDRDELYSDDERAPQRRPLRFERLSIRFDLGALKVEVGKQPLTWGRTDAMNPTDNLTPRDWTDPLREVRLPPWSLRANIESGRWEGELALVPSFAPSRLPRLGGRWIPLEAIRVPNPLFPLEGPPELEVVPTFAEPKLPATSLNNLQVGVRAGRHGRRGEWALSWYRGFDDAAHVDVSAGLPDLGLGIVPLTLTTRFPRLEVVGADGVVIAGAWAWRFEAGHFRFPASRDDSFLLYELDAEWTRGAWRVVAGYADSSGGQEDRSLGERLTLTVDGDSRAGSVSLDRGFLPALFVHLGRSLPTEWEASFDATIGTEEGDSLIRLSGSLPVSDALRLGAELHIVRGDKGSFFGAWRDNDRLRIVARLSY